MTASFKWYPLGQSQGSDLAWNAGSYQRSCDEIRFGFVADHVGVDAVFNGELFARFSYIEPTKSTYSLLTPRVRVTMGDQSQPSKFTLQGVIKLDQPITIKKNTTVTLTLAPFPITAVGTETVTQHRKWFIVSYFLRGNELSV